MTAAKSPQSHVTLAVKDGTEMRAFLARPAPATGKRPGVLVLQEAFGVNAYVRGVATRLASMGYVALAPELFHRSAAPGTCFPYGDFSPIVPHLEGVTPETLSLDLEAAASWLRADPNVDAERLAAIGFCMGGRAAYLANAILPLRAAVSFYGGRIAPDLLPLAPKQHGPLLFFWGGLDAHIDLAQRSAVDSALAAAKKHSTNVCFAAADHGFATDDKPSYHPECAQLAWAMVSEFLTMYLAKG